MDSDQIRNMLWIIFGVIWAFKIGYHFNYLKAIDPAIRENNFFSFYVKLNNLMRSSSVIFPALFSRRADKSTSYQHTIAKKTLTTTLIFWGWIVVMGFYFSTHPPKKEQIKKYDFTKGVPENYP